MVGLRSLKPASHSDSLFRWRGGDVSRLEGLTDAVFAISLTLLALSLEVPETYGEMITAFQQIPVFLACFALLYMCWFFHYQFHRRYGLEDGTTIFLNGVLLVVILIYVYPLKFLFTLLFGMLFGSVESYRGSISNEDWPNLMIIYGLGYSAIFLIYAVMTVHAYRMRDRLELNPVECYLTIATVRCHLISVAVGAVSVGLVLVSASNTQLSGMIYMSLGPLQGIHGHVSAKVATRLRDSMES